MRASILAFMSLCLSLTACRPSSEDLLDQAEKDAVNQRSQLARHLYTQVIRAHTTKDTTRKRALTGLVELSLNQLHDYPLAFQTMDVAIEEFGGSDRFRELRLRLAMAARLQTQDPDRAMKYLEPIHNLGDLSIEELLEISQTQLALHRYDEATAGFQRALDLALQQKSCRHARELQMELMQVHTLQKKCLDGIQIGKRDLFAGCKSDSYSINLETAHCYEVEGDPGSAIRIYEKMLEEQPQNSRIEFLLAQVKKRQKERQIK